MSVASVRFAQAGPFRWPAGRQVAGQIAATRAGSGPFASKPRFLVPAFPLLIPLALAFARGRRVRPRHAYLLGGALAAISVAYGAYVVTVSVTPL